MSSPGSATTSEDSMSKPQQVFRSRRQSSIQASPLPLAHVHLRPVLNLSPSFLTNVSKSCVYDDTHKQLLVVADNKLLFWNLPEIGVAHSGGLGARRGEGDKISSPAPGSPKAADFASMDSVVSPQVCFLSQGPVITARFSPDRKLLAVQRSETEIEFVNQQDGSQFWQKCKSSSKLGLGPEVKLLGFFWCSDMAKFDIVFVTTAGLELHKLLDSRKGLQLKDAKKHPIRWYKYTADTRLIIIATGDDCTRLLGYQFAPQGLIKLPRFDIDLQNEGKSKGKQALTSDSIHPIALYGKLFCCHINPLAERVVLYRLYKDAIIKQFSYPTYSPHMGISIVDNLLLVHHMNSGLVMIFDIMTNNMQPFVSPLPVLCKGSAAASSNYAAAGRLQSPANTMSLSPSTRSESLLSVMASQEEENDGGEDKTNPFKRGNKAVCVTMSNFLLAMDVGNEMVWMIELDLNAIAMSCPNRLHTISFLHRRVESKHPRWNPKKMIIGTVKTMVQENESIPILKQAFDIICYVIASSPGSNLSERAASQKVPSPAKLASNNGGIDLQQLHEQIFESLFEDQAVEPALLFRAMETFYLCSSSFRLKLPPCFFELMIDMLIAMRKFEVLTQYLSGHFFEDSKDLARKLESLSADYPHMSQYALDMYFRMKEYDECCAVLFKHGRLIDALKMLKDYHLSSIAPTAFLDAAEAVQDPMVYASVYRFCKEFVPGFRAKPTMNMNM
ncbi:Mic1 domain-containing protein [Chloropicon primus]|uniref:Uncharacterized protein n=1 Tax=Chloropicon primus TaxID=1764295 RepID=A0A5B8MRU9_9CHLO|nr:hypothetical protein A3770_10p58370 [Chloropicon primus]UPR02531.1 Mic1 domain-containing protein [Chloropicon primus]|eukprot:QDZ23319.1 hypothetical protein A3770_10p58370 [Chloropicon primus]